MNSNGQIYQNICETHNEYLEKVNTIIDARSEQTFKSDIDKIDQLIFHVIEELVETRRTYPHKFWKQTKEEFNKEQMLEEVSDVFLMLRSLSLEICRKCNISEYEFLERILSKANTNLRRIANGY